MLENLRKILFFEFRFFSRIFWKFIFLDFYRIGRFVVHRGALKQLAPCRKEIGMARASHVLKEALELSLFSAEAPTNPKHP